MKISTKNTKVLCLSTKPTQYIRQVSGNTLQQVEKFKYLGVGFTSNGSRSEETDTRVGKASAVLREFIALWSQNGSFKRRKAVSFQICYCSILTYGHESWAMTEIILTRVRGPKMGFGDESTV